MKGATRQRKIIKKQTPPKKTTEKSDIVSRLRSKKGVSTPFSKSVDYEGSETASVDTSSTSKDSFEYVRRPELYKKILDMPCYDATTEEFNEPLLLVQNLSKKGYAKFGCVKIKAPRTWKAHLGIDPKLNNFTTRKQTLSELNEGKAFEHNMDPYTLDEFQKFADKFAKSWKNKAPFKFNNKFRANEYEYWAMVEDPLFQKEDVTVEYAADLPSNKFGSGFPTVHGKRMTEELDVDDPKTHPFNFNNLSRAKDSLFQVITRKNESISGISSPWIYSGMLFASFCWHVEDLYMYSVNYMHKGAPKTWYCVPSEYKEAFDDIIKEKFGLLFIKNPNLLHNIVLTMNPLELVKRNIPVYRTEQSPGEFIITFPNVYHAGFSHGFNVTEAVNMAVPEWIPFAIKATADYAKGGFMKNCTFPYEWIVHENARKIDELDFSEGAKELLFREYRKMKDKEIEKRETVMKCYSKVIVKEFDNPNQRYDAHTCSSCKNYTYLSYLSCMACKKKGCTHHVTICECLNPKMVLNIRFTDEELDVASMQTE